MFEDSTVESNVSTHIRMSNELALQLRLDYAAGAGSVRDLGIKYNINRATVSQVLRGKTWKEAGGPIMQDARNNAWMRHKKTQQTPTAVPEAKPRRVHSPISDEQVERIRHRYAEHVAAAHRNEHNPDNQMALAREHNITMVGIHYIVTGRRRRDAGGPITPAMSLPQYAQ